VNTFGPDGDPTTVSRNTIDRWVRSNRQRGLDGLRDRPRSDRGKVRGHHDLIEEAVKLGMERHERKVLFSDAPPVDNDPQARLLVQM
jgi:transposase